MEYFCIYIIYQKPSQIMDKLSTYITFSKTYIFEMFFVGCKIIKTKDKIFYQSLYYIGVFLYYSLKIVVNHE